MAKCRECGRDDWLGAKYLRIIGQSEIYRVSSVTDKSVYYWKTLKGGTVGEHIAACEPVYSLEDLNKEQLLSYIKRFQV